MMPKVYENILVGIENFEVSWVIWQAIPSGFAQDGFCYSYIGCDFCLLAPSVLCFL